MKRLFIGDTLKRTKQEIEDGIERIVGENEYEEWKEFAFKGRMAQMAIAFILGAAFTSVVQAIASNIIMPVIDYALSFTGDNWRKFTFSPVENLNIEVGIFLGKFVDFILISILLYVMYRKFLRPLQVEHKKPKIKCIETKDCPLCYEKIHWKATRCPSCTGEIE